MIAATSQALLRRGGGAPEARRALADEVRRVLAEPTRAPYERVYVAVDVPDAFFWLEAQPFEEKGYWSGRNEQGAAACVGVALRARSTGAALPALPELHLLPSEARFYGGGRFDGRAQSAAEWDDFAGWDFILPRFELTTGGEQTLLSCNLFLPEDAGRVDEILRSIERLDLRPGRLAGSMPSPVGRRDVPDRAGWNENIDWALNAFERGSLEKIVLARRATFAFAESVDPFLLLKNLSAGTPGCFHFLFQPRGGASFVGASPERLYCRDGREIRTEAVAGTRPRGGSEHEDARLLQELLGSEKEQREHGYVRDAVRDVLAEVCDAYRVDADAGEMRLAMGRHLYSPASGMLKEDVSDADLLRRLHPTPAVGGFPKQEAIAAIAGREPFDRGWYAGPVGWIGRDGAEFAVGIRSGLVEGGSLSLFSGAGIVAGSDPAAEYAEIEQKIGDFARVLGLADGRS